MQELYHQEGPQTVEQVFHSLHTRLFNIEQGKINKTTRLLWNQEDDEEYKADMIQYIVANVFYFPASSSLTEIDYCLKKMEGLNKNLPTIIETADFGKLIIAGSNDDEKAEAMKSIADELDFYTTKLKTVKVELASQLKGAAEIRPSLKEDAPIELSRNIKFKTVPDGHISKLDKYQSALLFHFLREKGAINNLSDIALAQIVSLLTGHSEQNIRQDALTKIWDVKTDKAKNRNNKDQYHNLNEITKLLESILSDIRGFVEKGK
jgi:hypothetical protein